MQKIFCLTSKCLIVLFLLVFINSIQAQNNDNWEQIGPEGGKVNSIVLNSNDDILVASTGRIFIQLKDTDTWELSNSGLENLYVNVLASDNMDLYAGTNDGVYKSTDNGESWFPSNKDIQKSYVLNIMFSKEAIFITVEEINNSYRRNYYYSKNGGNDWIEINLESFGNVGDLVVNDKYMYIVSTGEGLLQSEDLGVTWKNVDVGINKYFLGASYDGNLYCNNYYVIIFASEHGYYISEDDGKSWDKFVDEPYYSNYHFYLFDKDIYYYSSGPYESSLYHQKEDKTISNLGFTLKNSSFISFYRKGNTIYLGTYLEGLFSSIDDAPSWVSHLKGFNNFEIRVLFANNSKILSAYFERIYSSINIGKSWSQYNLEKVSESTTNFFEYKPDNFFITTSGINYYQSSIIGNLWQKYQSPYAYNIKDIVKSGNNIIAAVSIGTSEISFFDESKNTWEGKSNNGISQNIVNNFITYGNNILAGTKNGIYESQDNGNNWFAKDNIISKKEVKKLVKTEENIFALTIDGIYKSTDLGNNWEIINSEFVDSNTIAFISVQNYLFLADDKGMLYLSKDLGNTWQVIYDGSNHLATRITALARHGDYLLVGTKASSILKAKFSDLGLIVGLDENAQQENLNRVSPNPASDYITINLERCATLLKCGTSVVKIYDVMGMKIQSTKVEAISYTEHSFHELPLQRIDISNLSPGVYFVKIVGSNCGCSIVEKFVKY